MADFALVGEEKIALRGFCNGDHEPRLEYLVNSQKTIEDLMAAMGVVRMHYRLSGLKQEFHLVGDELKLVRAVMTGGHPTVVLAPANTGGRELLYGFCHDVHYYNEQKEEVYLS
jgi:hypothetical protein